jgi:hypothetical protein
MKAVGILLTILMTGSLALAKYSCQNDDQKLVVDPSHKRLTLTKDGKPHRLKILNPANHGFQMFGNTAKAFEVEGGYVVGIKDTKNSSKKDLSIFKRGEVVATFNDCTEK